MKVKPILRRSAFYDKQTLIICRGIFESLFVLNMPRVFTRFSEKKMFGALKYGFENYMVGRYNAANRELCEPARKFLLDSMKDYALFKADTAVFPGEGAVTSLMAFGAVGLAKAGIIGKDTKVVFVGGRKPARTEFAWKIHRDLAQPGIDALATLGINRPGGKESEGAVGKRMFIVGLEVSGLDPKNYEIIDAGGGNNIQANLAAASLFGAGAKGGSVLFGALPYSLPRIAATWEKMQLDPEDNAKYKLQREPGDDSIITLVPFWPVQLGITPDTWMQNLMARFVVVQECKKIGLPTPETAPYVVTDKFCLPFTPERIARQKDRASRLREWQLKAGILALGG